VVSFAAIATVAASIVMTTEAMFLSAHDAVVVLVVIVLSVPAERRGGRARAVAALSSRALADAREASVTPLRRSAAP
jgi:hypothetical protein